MKKGFSLVELLIVLAVIAALVSSVTMFAGNAIKKAKATTIARNLKSISLAAQKRLLIEGPDFFRNLPSGAGIQSLMKDVTEGYSLYVLIKRSGEVNTTAMYTTTGVDTELVCEMLPDAFVAENDEKYTLLNGDYFCVIRWDKKLSAEGFINSGSTVTYVPKDFLCQTQSFSIY